MSEDHGAGQAGDGDPAPVEVELDPITSLFAPPTYDLEAGRDKVRAVLALGLLGLLIGVVALAFVLVFFPPQKLATDDVDLKSRMLYVQALLAPVSGLFGAATGFYYGTGKNSR